MLAELKPNRLWTQISSLLTTLSSVLLEDTLRPRKGQQSQAWELISYQCSLLIAAGGQQRVTTKDRFRELGHISVCQNRSPLSCKGISYLGATVTSIGPWGTKTKRSIQSPHLKVKTLRLGRFRSQEWVKNWSRTECEKGTRQVGNQKDFLKGQVPRVAKDGAGTKWKKKL